MEIAPPNFAKTLKAISERSDLRAPSPNPSPGVADKSGVTIARTALADPTAEKLELLLKGQRKVLEQLLFRTTELELVITGGEHRFIGRAMDEIEEAETELALFELSRAIIAEALIPPGREATASTLLEVCADRPTLVALIGDLRRLVNAIEHSRERARDAATERARHAGAASARLETAGFGPYA